MGQTTLSVNCNLSKIYKTKLKLTKQDLVLHENINYTLGSSFVTAKSSRRKIGCS